MRTKRVGCIDVGGAAIKAGILEGSALIDVSERATPPAGDGVVERVVTTVAAVVEEMTASAPVDAIGFVVPGIVDAASGTAVWSENLGWSEVPFRALLQERLDLPVAFGHDVRAGGLAEARMGAGVGHRDVVFLPIGTGIAAAMVTDGVVYDRRRPTGEVGHVDVGHDELCVCGLRGCLEAISSAAAISRRYRARTGVAASAADIARGVADGDADAQAVWTDAVEGLGFAISWLAAVLAPDVVVIGGGLASAGSVLLDPLRMAVDRRLSHRQRPAIVPSATGSLAGCLGAGLLARDLLEEGR